MTPAKEKVEIWMLVVWMRSASQVVVTRIKSAAIRHDRLRITTSRTQDQPVRILTSKGIKLTPIT